MSLNFGYSPPGLGRIKKDIKMNGHKILNLPSPTSTLGKNVCKIANSKCPNFLPSVRKLTGDW